MAEPAPIKRPHKVPPHSIEAEMAIIGSVLIDNSALSILTEYLTEDAFYKKAHRDIFHAMGTASEKGEAIDVITLSDEAKAAIAASNEAHAKSAESTAHVARKEFMANKIASGATTTDIRFGDVVSRIARGISTESLFGAASKADDERSKDVTKISAADGETSTTNSTTQEQTVVPTEENTAGAGSVAPIAGDIIRIAAVTKPISKIDILDLLSSDEGDAVDQLV